ncbi:MAG: 3-phosphoserine/phosphohydroxythreonine transaminase, partial [Chitinophagales bacterium]|nr:3-phosphoserine/phosphohydroxythreonine transaminase [Chitinophagales bacterium]
EARLLVKQILRLDHHKEVLFLQGGASQQFFMVPMNLLRKGEVAAYFDTGQWSSRAIAEAKKIGSVEVLASSASSQYNHIPKVWMDNPQLFQKTYSYIHITSNNTVFGTQWSKPLLENLFEMANCPIVADMSSDLFSRELDFNRFGLIYAGAQKNFGPAGVTLVIVDKRILKESEKQLPTLLNYQKLIEAESMYNTPAVFAVFICWLTLQWIKRRGLENLEQESIRKAQLLYEAIDDSTLFKGTVSKEDRSRMNVCFKTKNPDMDKLFLEYCENNNLVGLAGYRTVGGFRASIYNAMPVEGVQKLIQCIKEFESKNGIN